MSELQRINIVCIEFCGSLASLVVSHIDFRMDVEGFEVDADAVQVLVGVGELRPEETDGPGELHPEHEQGQSGKRAVDGVIARHPDLRVDIEELQHLHGDTREDARHDGTRQAHLRIRHIDIEHDEKYRQ